ncbi:MAG: NADH-quinone oxidoreductase subunit J [Nitrospiraceae bacterium]|nr:NADH-quinone oxidoreductase subunit J [Nitrospiraceae bacterium]
MIYAFYIAAAVAIVSTAMVIVQMNIVHALLYLILSLLSVAVIFFVVGAPFVAALEVIIYAGAIMILFVFVIMMLNLGTQSYRTEKGWMRVWTWVGPVLLASVLLADVVYMLVSPARLPGGGRLPPAFVRPYAMMVGPRAVGVTLFGPYLIGVELASILLLSGLIGALHLGRAVRPESFIGPVSAKKPGSSKKTDRGEGTVKK